MSSDVIQADYDQLARIVQELYGESADIENLTHRIKDLIDQLEGGGWSGMGARAFYNEMHHDVLPGMERLIQALSEAGDTVNQVSTLMRRVEEEAAALFSPGSGLGARVHADPGLVDNLNTVYRAVINPYDTQELVDEYKNSGAAQHLMEAADKAGLRLVLNVDDQSYDLGGKGDHTVTISVEAIDEAQFGGSVGGYQEGDKIVVDREDYDSLLKMPDGDRRLAGLIAHEMQHSVDEFGDPAYRGQLNVDPFSQDTEALKADYKTVITNRVGTENRAYERLDAVFENRAYSDDGTLTGPEIRAVLVEKYDYAERYMKQYNDIYIEAYYNGEVGYIRHLDIDVTPEGEIVIDIFDSVPVDTDPNRGLA